MDGKKEKGIDKESKAEYAKDLKEYRANGIAYEKTGISAATHTENLQRQASITEKRGIVNFLLRG